MTDQPQTTGDQVTGRETGVRAPLAAGLRRPEQLGLLDEADSHPVGPLPLSVVQGTNADLIASIAPLYLAGSVLDVTYGRGMWWRRFRPEPFGFHDLALDGVDFRQLPYGDGSWDAVCFDPPYVPRQGPSAATMERDQDFRDRFGLAESRGGAELRQLMVDGLQEAARVSRRWVLVKCCDYVNARAFVMGHLVMLNAGIELGLRPHDLVVHHSGTGPGGSQIRTVLRARRAHSYLIVFRKPRAVAGRRTTERSEALGA